MPNLLTIAQATVATADAHKVTDIGDIRSIRAARFETLLAFDERLSLIPLLATDWTATPDARGWTFRLRAGVRFHNGAALVGEDVAWSIHRMASGEAGGTLASAGAFAGYLGQLEIEVTDPTTVRLRSPTPLADLPELLTEVAIVRQRADGSLVGTGPYIVDGASVPRSELIMSAFDDYWSGQVPAEHVRWVAEPDSERRLQMAIQGDVDLATKIEPHVDIPADRERSVLSTQCVVFFLAADRSPFDGPEARLAANLAVDVPELVASIMRGHAQPLDGPVGPQHLGHSGYTRPLPYDPERARSLLARSEISGRLQLFAPTSIPDEAPRLAEAVASSLSSAGAPTQMHLITDRTEYAHRVSQRNAGHLCCFDSTPHVTFQVLHEKLNSRVRDRWWQGYANRQVDALIVDAARTVDREQRAAIYAECLDELRRDPAWIYLYSPTDRAALGPRVADWQPRADGRVDVRHIMLR